MIMSFSSVLWQCWLGDRKGIQPVIKLGVGVCWWWRFNWSFARLIAPVVTTTSIILSSNKITNGDILVPANPGPPGKWPLKRRGEREIMIKTCLKDTLPVCRSATRMEVWDCTVSTTVSGCIFCPGVCRRSTWNCRKIAEIWERKIVQQ